jgi:hypothetical protein
MTRMIVYIVSLSVIMLSSFIVQLVDATLGLTVGIVGVLVAFFVTLQSLYAENRDNK